MNRFHEGERVNLTIAGARVADSFRSRKGGPGGPFEDTGEVLVLIVDDSPSNERSMAINLAAPSVTVERVTPENWPPYAGDLWQDAGGRRWFAQQRPSGIQMIPANLGIGDGPNTDELPEYLLSAAGPLVRISSEMPF